MRQSIILAAGLSLLLAANVRAGDTRLRLDTPQGHQEARASVDPAGINGALLLTGTQPTQEAWKTFHELAHGKKAHVVAIDDENSNLADYLRETGVEHLHAIDAAGDLPADAQWKDVFRKATGVWLGTSLSKVTRSLCEIEEAKLALRSLLRRGGVVGAAGEVAEHLAEYTFIERESTQTQHAGLAFLPSGVVDASAAVDADSRVTAALLQRPGIVGYEIPPPACMVIKGRRIRSVGEGSLHILLAKSESAEPATIELNARRRTADLTALRLAALDRAGPPFPPSKMATPRVEKGTLILIGGGGMPRDIVARFVKLAGGEQASIVVLPTAMPDPIVKEPGIAEAFRKAGAKRVRVLPGRTRNVVESDEYLSALREATGLWFGGGRQWRFADAYLHTQAHQRMHDVLRRGGVIMGSSAGASIQAEYLARANPLGNRDIIAEGYERGLAFLPGAAVDQHFRQRGRFKDMTLLVDTYPQLLGIGIDESTALVVAGSVGEVVGRGGVHFYDRRKPVQDGKPDYETVHPSGKYHLAERKILDSGTPSPKKPNAETSKDGRP